MFRFVFGKGGLVVGCALVYEMKLTLILKLIDCVIGEGRMYKMGTVTVANQASKHGRKKVEKK